MTKIKAKATQNFTWNGVEIRKDAPLSLTAGEFGELEPVGLVKRAKAPKAEPATKVPPITSSASPAKADPND